MPNIIEQLKKLPWWYWGLVVVVVMLDQITKHWAETSFDFQQASPVTSFWYWTLRYNPGAAFSFLADSGGWQRWFFTAIAIGMSGFLTVWMTKLYRQSNPIIELLALSLILAGALGNLYDRMAYGHVIDFIVFHYNTWEFPAFNLADMAISIGAGLLIFDVLIIKRKQA